MTAPNNPFCCKVKQEHEFQRVLKNLGFVACHLGIMYQCTVNYDIRAMIKTEASKSRTAPESLTRGGPAMAEFLSCKPLAPTKDLVTGIALRRANILLLNVIQRSSKTDTSCRNGGPGLEDSGAVTLRVA